MKPVITRFAPSPTGMLHIGGARTALFNYLFAQNQQGKFLLRIEDTDKERSTEEAITEILSSLKWLGIDYDGEIFYQSKAANRHKQIAERLVKEGKAYYCYATVEELDALRQEASKNNKRFKYDRRWREAGTKEIPSGVEPVIRIKAPLAGVTEFDDQVQGSITINNQEHDDFVILRNDGSPTYMLAVVVDDHDMGITHIIRGDDHLTNCSKQILLYEALGWEKPVFAHIPLIYGQDGRKMSKRHGATAVSEYKNMGYLAIAMRNYLLRLGFSHGDDEIITDEQAIAWFNLQNLGKSPARFDIKKLNNLNGHYLRETSDKILLEHIINNIGELSEIELERLVKLIPELKIRSITLNDLVYSAKFIKEDFMILDELTDKAKVILADTKEIVGLVVDFVAGQSEFLDEQLYENSKVFAEKSDIKIKKIAGLLRVALTGSHISPSVFKIMEIFGQEAVLARLKKIL